MTWKSFFGDLGVLNFEDLKFCFFFDDFECLSLDDLGVFEHLRVFHSMTWHSLKIWESFSLEYEIFGAW